MPHQGYQEPGIEEAVVYGGVFEEDSEGGCVSLVPGRGGGHGRENRWDGGSSTEGRNGYNGDLEQLGPGNSAESKR